jgi:hypothetical protein
VRERAGRYWTCLSHPACPHTAHSSFPSTQSDPLEIVNFTLWKLLRSPHACCGSKERESGELLLEWEWMSACMCGNSTRRVYFRLSCQSPALARTLPALLNKFALILFGSGVKCTCTWMFSVPRFLQSKWKALRKKITLFANLNYAGVDRLQYNINYVKAKWNSNNQSQLEKKYKIW